MSFPQCFYTVSTSTLLWRLFTRFWNVAVRICSFSHKSISESSQTCSVGFRSGHCSGHWSLIPTWQGIGVWELISSTLKPGNKYTDARSKRKICTVSASSVKPVLILFTDILELFISEDQEVIEISSPKCCQCLRRSTNLMWHRISVKILENKSGVEELMTLNSTDRDMGKAAMTLAPPD